MIITRVSQNLHNVFGPFFPFPTLSPQIEKIRRPMFSTYSTLYFTLSTYSTDYYSKTRDLVPRSAGLGISPSPTMHTNTPLKTSTSQFTTKQTVELFLPYSDNDPRLSHCELEFKRYAMQWHQRLLVLHAAICA